MISLFKKKATQSFNDFGFIFTDIHSHLLPGIDDGAKDLNDSLFLIEKMMDLGFRRLITTPHIYSDYYPNTSAIIREKGEMLKDAVKAKGWEIKIDYAAEYFMDEYFEELLEKKDILTLPGNYLLFELPFFSPPPQLESVVFKMTLKGYRPILAHPERYLYWLKNHRKYDRLMDMGCQLQINLPSLFGMYGADVKKNAEWLIEQNMVEFVGTDLHNENQINAIQTALSKKQFHILDKLTLLNKSVFAN